MEMIWLVLAMVVASFSVGCAAVTAFEVATGKMGFLSNLSFWGAQIFHLATALLALWLFGLWLG